MPKTGLRIVFMGTSAFAVPSLRALCQTTHPVVGVVTVPDKPQGRGKKVGSSPVKICATSLEIPILQPERLRDHDFQQALRAWRPDLQVVVAFRMLPATLWQMPPMGTVNLHASLLPKYRGAAPIHWAIINGEQETGLTTFFVSHEIDTGPIILQRRIKIAPEDTAGSLHDRLMTQGAALVVDTVNALHKRHHKGVPQVLEDLPPKAPKILKQDCALNWRCTAEEIERRVRGLYPTPGAFCVRDNKVYKLHRVAAGRTHKAVPLPAGMWQSDGRGYLHIGCTDGQYVAVERIQRAGGREMSICDFLRGLSIRLPNIHLIAAFDEQRVMGNDGALPWHLPDDLKRFRRLTWQQVVVMGRRSYQGLPAQYKPLPGRVTIVLTRTKTRDIAPGCWQASSLDEALLMAQQYLCGEVFVAGGAEVYALALEHPLLRRLSLTRVRANVGGDTFFPPIDFSRWVRTEHVSHDRDTTHPYAFTFHSYRLADDGEAGESSSQLAT